MMSALPAFGRGQTWQDVTGSRAAATTYTNTSGKSIMVYVAGSSAVSSVTSDGVTTENGVNVRVVIVNNGKTYSVSGNFTKWMEYR